MNLESGNVLMGHIPTYNIFFLVNKGYIFTQGFSTVLKILDPRKYLKRK